jgi:hypothetical protein
MTLDQAIDAAMQLTPSEMEMLLDILQGRWIEARRGEIALGAQESLAEYRAGKLKTMTAEAIIEELHHSLEEGA